MGALIPLYAPEIFARCGRLARGERLLRHRVGRSGLRRFAAGTLERSVDGGAGDVEEFGEFGAGCARRRGEARRGALLGGR